MKMLDITLNNVANFDETNVDFSPECGITINKRGECTITVRKAESSQRCTIMLGVSGAVFKFPLYVIFKGKVGGSGQIEAQMKWMSTKQLTITQGMYMEFPLLNFYGF